MSDFVHLRVRTEYSIQDSIVRVKPLMKTVLEQGMNAVGISDHCNFFAAVKIYQAAISLGIKPLFGVDLPCCFPDAPDEIFLLPVLCQNETGYRNATRLISRAYLEGQTQGSPRIEYEWLDGATDGLIALSGGFSGRIAHLISKDEVSLAEAFARQMSHLFPNRFYLEIQRVGRPFEARDNAHLVTIADVLNLPLVATNEVRFLKSHEFDAHTARVCIHDGAAISDNSSAARYTPGQYFRSTAEMKALFSDIPQAIENTVEITRR